MLIFFPFPVKNVTKVIVNAAPIINSNNNVNPYAQPGRIGVEPSSVTDGNQIVAPPAIPDPDYSMSESEDEADNSVRLATNIPSSNNNNNNSNLNTLKKKPKEKEEIMVAETSGNSNTSGSSTGSSSIPHSFSVDELQKIRSQLKSSKSFPNAFQNTDKTGLGTGGEGEGDNSSSGVSSDQEIMVNTPQPTVTSNYVEQKPHIIQHQQPAPPKHLPLKMNVKVEEKKVTIASTIDARSDDDSPSPPLKGFQRSNSLTRKQASMIAANRAKALQLQGQAVSLQQLPPPIEADSDDEVDGTNFMAAPYIGKLFFTLPYFTGSLFKFY